jgi:hypothetical protein
MSEVAQPALRRFLGEVPGCDDARCGASQAEDLVGSLGVSEQEGDEGDAPVARPLPAEMP